MPDNVKDEIKKREIIEKYWKTHSKVWKDADRKNDIDGLTSSCYSVAPVWYNKFFDYFQKMNYLRLLRSVRKAKGRKALDIGCGAGRWCRVLRNKGWSVTGVDIQKETIEANKKLIKGVSFMEMNLNQMKFKKNSFALVSSVMVLQHMTYRDQKKIFSDINKILAKNGYFLIIENTKYEMEHVFARNHTEWVKLARDNGFELVKYYGEEYAPLSRIFDTVVIGVLKMRRKQKAGKTEKEAINLADAPKRDFESKKMLKTKIYFLLKLPVMLVSYPIEYLCALMLPDKYAVHGAYLFRKKVDKQ